MRRPQGLAVLTCRTTGNEKEIDTFTCKHCQRIVHVRTGERPEDIGGLCKVCMGLICSGCAGQPCKTIEQRLAEDEASYHARRSYGF